MSNNKSNLKSMLVGVIVGAGLFGGVVGASTVVAGNVYLSSYPIMLNGKSYTSTSPILNYNGTTYLPLREMGTAVGSEVSFKNNTIYIDSSKNTTNNNTTTGKPVTYFSSVTIEEDAKTTIPVNLARYNATSATISVSDSCIKVSQSVFTTSGNVTVTGSKAGKATLTVKYNTGDAEYTTVTVEEKEDSEEVEVKVGSSENVKIDLDDYDADEAKLSITSGSSYITLSKTTFTKNGTLKITGKKEGEATIKIKYDSGDVAYIYVDVEKKSSSSKNDDDLEIEVGDYENIKIDLDDYDADEAKVSITSGSSYITLNKTTFTSNGTLKITGKKEGSATVRIKFDSGDTEYIYVEVIDDDDDDDDIEIEVGDYKNVKIDLDDYDADEAEVSISSGSSYVTLNKTTFTSNGTLKITGKKEGSAKIKIKYDSGDTEYIYVKVTDDEDSYDYEDELTIETGDYDYVYVDLRAYDADEAELKVISGSSYVTLAKTSTKTSGQVKVTGKKEGTAIIRITYDTDDVEYFLIEVED